MTPTTQRQPAQRYTPIVTGLQDAGRLAIKHPAEGRNRDLHQPHDLRRTQPSGDADHAPYDDDAAKFIRPRYNKANLLEPLDANLRGADRPLLDELCHDIDYNAKGQRTLIEYGNGAHTTYDYDITFRLRRLFTRSDFPVCVEVERSCRNPPAKPEVALCTIQDL